MAKPMFKGVTQKMLAKARAANDAELAAVKLLKDKGYVVYYRHKKSK